MVDPRRQGEPGRAVGDGVVGAGRRLSSGAAVFEHPDYDLIADFDGQLVRVQVKTSTCWVRNAGYECDSAHPWRESELERGCQAARRLALRRLVRPCWRRPAVVSSRRRRSVAARAIVVGGPKYAAFEVEPGDAASGAIGAASQRDRISARSNARLTAPGGIPERSKGQHCKRCWLSLPRFESWSPPFRLSSGSRRM